MSINKSETNTNEVFDPQVIVAIAVDCAALYASDSGMWQDKGIYMFDDNLVNSYNNKKSQGTNELNTVIAPMQHVGFNVYAIDEKYMGAKVEIKGFEFSGGTNVFTSNGWPSPQTAKSSTCQWMGQAMEVGDMTYQIKIGISYPNQVEKVFWWDPFLHCH